MCLSDHYIEINITCFMLFQSHLKPSLIIEMKLILPLIFLLCVHENLLLLVSDSLFPVTSLVATFLMCQTIGHIQQRCVRQ